MLDYARARAKVVEVVQERRAAPARERIPLGQALGRVVAETVLADRDYPPFPRATRDGFAVRAADVARPRATLELIGEVRAGQAFPGRVGPGQAVEIMTGAALPTGADAVVMLEHAKVAGRSVTVEFAVEPGQHVTARASEACAGQALLEPGRRLGYAELALLAQVGRGALEVYSRPRLGILSTGDEVVDMAAEPGPFQIRGSNAVSLGAQAELAGAAPVPLGNAPDEPRRLRERIEAGLDEDLLVVTGGVSVGKYDLVEAALGELGAEIVFESLAIRPGRPAVFAWCRGRPVFGLPGNPVSTMVCFELLIVPAIDLLGGTAARPLALFPVRLEKPVRLRAPLTHFLPARVSWTDDGPVACEIPWQGSGDVVALAEANCFLVLPSHKFEWAAGDLVEVLPRRDWI
jgi:molybdopterin molybdotransferase